MDIGIVSDSHGHKKRLKAAMAVFAKRRVDAIVHCGDLGSLACIGFLASGGVPAYSVAGNMDRHIPHLAAEAAKAGITFAWEMVEVPIGDGRYLAALHGDKTETMADLLHAQQFPYVCHGHTHRVRDERIGGVHVINPGAICYPRDSRHPTVAILSVETDQVEHVRLDN